jgi:hypothetical protein
MMMYFLFAYKGKKNQQARNSIMQGQEQEERYRDFRVDRGESGS